MIPDFIFWAVERASKPRASGDDPATVNDKWTQDL